MAIPLWEKNSDFSNPYWEAAYFFNDKTYSLLSVIIIRVLVVDKYPIFAFLMTVLIVNYMGRIIWECVATYSWEMANNDLTENIMKCFTSGLVIWTVIRCITLKKQKV